MGLFRNKSGDGEPDAPEPEDGGGNFDYSNGQHRRKAVRAALDALPQELEEVAVDLRFAEDDVVHTDDVAALEYGTSEDPAVVLDEAIQNHVRTVIEQHAGAGTADGMDEVSQLRLALKVALLESAEAHNDLKAAKHRLQERAVLDLDALGDEAEAVRRDETARLAVAVADNLRDVIRSCFEHGTDEHGIPWHRLDREGVERVWNLVS